MHKSVTYRDLIVDEFRRRQKRNAAYSLRAFSRDLGLSSSRLSEVINGKVGISEVRADGIANKLRLNTNEKSLFVDLVQSEHGRSRMTKTAALTRIKARMLQSRAMNDDEFQFISDWHNLALIELLNVPGVEHSVASFSKKLGLTEEVVRETLDRLQRLGHIAPEGDRWVPVDVESTTTFDIPSKAIRNFQTQVLNLAQRTLEERDVAERDLSSLIFAFNSQQMVYAKERIREFRRTLVKELEDIGEKDSVYCLSVQFFELTEK